ncbi:hypothetical protein [Aliikangiella sp. IMCC44632]
MIVSSHNQEALQLKPKSLSENKNQEASESFSKAESASSLKPTIPLRPFTSDGCSSFPDGNFENKTLWLTCCEAHDKAYWLGGTYAQRKIADQELKVCVQQLGETAIAYIMQAGVRIGGSPFWPTSFRWGYGWEESRGYQAISANELARANQLLKRYEAEQANSKKD